jgi:glycosyltransferase involved in cell wall biosynthesis
LRNFLHTKSLQIGYWDSVKARKAYKAFESKVQPDVLYNQMVRTMVYVARSKYPKVMDFQDALSMNTERRLDHAHFLWHYILHFEFKMLRSTEYNSFKIFDALTIISDADSDAIPHTRNGDIYITPNGVDFDFFKPIECPKQYDVVFCGNMHYEPNVRAARYLASVVMPLVWKQMPEARLLLAGADPKKQVRELANDRVVVSGFVDDIRQSYASAKILAAPMLTGSGLQNKLLEAMSMRIPCVTTSIANDSLHAQAGKEVLIGDTAESFADHIVSLLKDDQLRSSLAQNGHDFVLQNFSWEKAGLKLEEVLKSVAKK